MINLDKLRKRLHYDPLTGIFYWLSNNGPKAPSGSIAGSIQSSGYRYIGIGQRSYLAHRLAWLMVTGEWPSTDIDHIDGDRSNNALTNLRLATRSENLANSRKKSSNTSGFKGVSFFKPKNKWRARITINYRDVHIGYFNSAKEAGAAYEIKAKQLFGAFARAA